MGNLSFLGSWALMGVCLRAEDDAQPGGRRLSTGGGAC
jgi:hypothetical protein